MGLLEHNNEPGNNYDTTALLSTAGRWTRGWTVAEFKLYPIPISLSTLCTRWKNKNGTKTNTSGVIYS